MSRTAHGLHERVKVGAKVQGPEVPKLHCWLDQKDIEPQPSYFSHRKRAAPENTRDGESSVAEKDGKIARSKPVVR